MAELQCPQISSLRERMGRAGSEASEVGFAAVASVFPKFYAVMSEHDEAEARRTAESMKANVTISWPKSRL